jgi:hypothetical protein
VLKKFSLWLDDKTHLAMAILVPSMILLLAFAYLPPSTRFVSAF